MLQDARFALRMLAMRPVTASVTIAVLAIAIAGSVLTFCLADAVLWHPVPFRDPERLVHIRGYHPGQPNQIAVFTRVLNAWAARDRVVSAVHVWSLSGSVIEWGDQVESVSMAHVTPGLITELGVSVLGRDFYATDVGQPRVILSHEYARSRFTNPRDAIGRSLRIDGDVHTIVGVAPAGLTFPFGRMTGWLPPAAGPSPVLVRAIARVRPELTFAQGAELTASTTHNLVGQAELRLVPLVTTNTNTVQAIVVAIAAAACLLIIGVANAGNLAVAEAMPRVSEMAVRRALGAGSWILVRGIVIEAAVRSTLAVALALLGIVVSLGVIAAAVPRILTFQSLRPITLDWRAVAFSATVAVVTTFAASIAPSLQVLRSDLHLALQSSAPTVTPRGRARDVLVVIQLAVTLVLVVAAGILVNGFVRLINVSPGYDAGGLTVVTLRIPQWRYRDGDSTAASLRTLQSSVLAVPGVTAATIADGMPPIMSFQAADDVETSDGAPLVGAKDVVGFAVVDDGFLSTLRIPILAGDPLTDAPDLPRAVVTQSLATRLWPGRDPIGQRFRLSSDDEWLTVEGVAGDVQLGGFDQPLGTLAVFRNRTGIKQPFSYGILVVRSSLPTGSIAAVLRSTVSRIFPSAPVTAQRATDLIAGERARIRFVVRLMSTLAIVAIVMSMVGIYGAFWCAVNQRRREIGVRLAIGAESGDVVMMIITESLRVVAVALVIGMPLALGASFAVRPLLFEVSPTDPATMVTVVVLLVVSAIAAAYLPARAASRIDPVETLRAQ